MNRLQEKLRDYHVILGSASPRRKELLAGLDIPFEIRTQQGDEKIESNLSYEEIPITIAQQKFEQLRPQLTDTDFLITADTLVFCKDKIIGKPHSPEDAKQMLQLLSGNIHTVVTGVCFGTKQKTTSFSDKTLVTFTPLSDDDIQYYIETYKPFDKAGSYGVQEWIGYMGIEKIEGSYYNVMGLPTQKLFEQISNWR